MRELEDHELDQVFGGIPLLISAWVALTDTAGWGAAMGAGAAGYGFGTVLSDMANHQGDNLMDFNLF